MVELPLVSIVTPSYNAERFIAETIESVHSQDYPNIEHIVIDGASTDGTQQILARYPHLVWVSEQDRGQSHALNKGFRRAKGEIIGWLNADDTYTPGAISFAIDYLSTHPKVDAIHSDCWVFDENSKPHKLSKSQPFNLKGFLMSTYTIKQPTFFTRRAVVDTLGGVNENLHYIMDKEFWLRVNLAFNMQYIPDRILANFRKCKGTKSYDCAHRFHTEWMQVLENAIEDDIYNGISLKLLKAAHQKASGQSHITSAVLASKGKNRSRSLHHLYLALYSDRNFALNKGYWFLVVKALLGLDLEKKRKQILSPAITSKQGTSR